jgi:hypothetical protein
MEDEDSREDVASGDWAPDSVFGDSVSHHFHDPNEPANASELPSFEYGNLE